MLIGPNRTHLVHCLRDEGFLTPSDIQVHALPHLTSEVGRQGSSTGRSETSGFPSTREGGGAFDEDLPDRSGWTDPPHPSGPQRVCVGQRIGGPGEVTELCEPWT